MGTIITSILKSRQPEMVLLMIGFADSGKTTILYQLKYGEKLNTAPTIGFNMETITIRGKEMTIWDLGGQPSIRKFWATYYNGKNGIIFVIDVTDADKISQTEVEFRELIKSRQLDGLPLLIYANKTDAKKRMSQVEIIDRLDLQTLDRKWYIQDADALTGKGVEEGILWLKAAIETEYSELPYIVKTWRWIGDVRANIRDIKNSIFVRIGKILSFGRSSQSANQKRQYLKSHSIKHELNRDELENYINLLKDKRGQLFDEFKREYAIMKDSPGQLSKRDSEELCKKIDKEMHQLFEEIQGAQKKLDAIV